VTRSPGAAAEDVGEHAGHRQADQGRDGGGNKEQGIEARLIMF
jgi:hypothetical protein